MTNQSKPMMAIQWVATGRNKKRRMSKKDVGKEICILLADIGFPDEVIQLVLLEIAKFGLKRNKVFVELFAGKANMTHMFRYFGLAAKRFDIEYNSEMNFVTIVGLAIAVVMVLQIMEQGLLWAGPQCSLWVWISLLKSGVSPTECMLFKNICLVCVYATRNLQIFK